MPRDPVAELAALPTIQERVDAVAADLKRPGRRHPFRALDSWLVAEQLFEMQLDGPDHGSFEKA